MNALEQTFLVRWRACGGPVLVPQFVFLPGRKFRLDFAVPAARVGIECNGGVFGMGPVCEACGRRKTKGHGTVQNILRDYEKQNAAQLAGWTVFQFAPTQMTPKNLKPVIQFIRELME